MYRRIAQPLMLVPLFVALAAGPLAAQPASPRSIVLVADPLLAPEITPAVAASIGGLLRQGIAKRGAVAADEQQVKDQLRKLRIPDLSTRDRATRVAAAMGAKTVLRYQVKRISDQLHVRIAVFFIDSGKAVMLERAMLFREVGTGVDAMLVELLPAATPSGGSPAAPATSAAPAAPAPAAPSGPGIFSRTNPHAGSGLVGRLHFGGSVPIGEQSDVLSMGFRLGAELGYQIRIGQFMSVTPQLSFSFSRWSLISDANINGTPVKGGLSTIAVLGGARYDVAIGPVLVWPAIHFGLGYASGSLEDDFGNSLSDSKAGFALGFNFGAQYMVARGFGAGIVFDITKAFVSDLGFGAGGFSFGLLFTGKLPFEPAE